MLTGAFTVIFVGVAMGCLAWMAQGWIRHAYQLYRQRFTDQAHLQLSEMFLFLDPVQLWFLMVLACVMMALLAYLSTHSLFIATVSGAGALCLPPWLLRTFRQRRYRRFEHQLPDLLLALSGALRAGAGLQSALQSIVSQSSAPLSQEFGLVLKEHRLGVSMDQALSRLRQRMPGEGTQLVVSALLIALHTGGNLAETLEKIGHTLRSRLHLLGRIDALTSQGRMQAWVMAGLPVLLGVALDYLEPEAMAVLWHSPLGWGVLALIAVLEITGIFLIRKIVKIQV